MGSSMRIWLKDSDRMAVDLLDEFRGMWIAEGLETGGEIREGGEGGSWEEMFATAEQRRRLYCRWERERMLLILRALEGCRGHHKNPQYNQPGQSRDLVDD
jgi:hypothetical protein